MNAQKDHVHILEHILNHGTDFYLQYCPKSCNTLYVDFIQ